MAERVGNYVVATLEHAGERFLARASPEAYGCLLMQVGATGALRAYDRTEAYWEQVQAILDFFFTAAERSNVCEDLMRCRTLRTAPECRPFLASVLAERRLQEMLDTARLTRSSSAE